MNKFKKEVEVVVVKTNKELIAEAISKLSPEDLALIYPPITRANFVVRKSWLGRNQVITFVNNKNQKITYNHDEVYTRNKERFDNMNCFKKYKSYTNKYNNRVLYNINCFQTKIILIDE